MGSVKKVLTLAIAFGVTSWLICSPEKFNPSVLKGKRVVITGASSGIGEQLAYQYAKNGASVFITARRVHLLEKVIDKCRQIGSEDAKFGYFPTDMNSMEQIKNFVTSSLERLGGLDVVIINHAHFVDLKNPDNVEESMKSLRTSLVVNLEAPAYIAALTLPHLYETGGNIGVVNSIAGKISMKYSRPYTTSKFALDGYFASLRDEIKDTNVSVTNVILGLIDTEAARKLVAKAARTINFHLDFDDAAASPIDTAEFIMKGVAKREREIYYPPAMNFIVFIREILLRFNLLGRI